MLSPNAVDMMAGRNLRLEDLRELEGESHRDDAERHGSRLLRRLARSANRLMSLVL